MNDLSAFPITRKWPAHHPDRLQLYSLPTPNGAKVSIMLEECGLPYEAHLVRFDSNDQFSPEFLSLNPNNKIPAIIDPDGPNGQPLALFESGAILVKLHGAPMYFYRKGKGRYKAAPEENLKAALAAQERKRLQAEKVAAYVELLKAHTLPPEFSDTECRRGALMHSSPPMKGVEARPLLV